VLAARYNSHGSALGCLEGTRVDIVAGILRWCAGRSDTFSIYWLAGHAGTGKTTIAKTLCEKLALQGRLWITTFFASRNSADRRDSLRILCSLIHELAFTDVIACRRVLAVIRSHDDITEQPLREQIQILIRAAIKDLMGEQSLILVVDALDECFTEDGVEGGKLISVLADVLADLPVKLVVTSRMENSLSRMFGSLPSKTVRLHEIEGTNVTSDVRLILHQGFQEIVEKNNILTRPWPSKRDLDILVERTDRLIIFASTVLKFVGNNRAGSPERLLNQIMEQTFTSGMKYHFMSIDKLYITVLEAAARYNGDDAETNAILCRRLRDLLGSIVLLQEPMSIHSLALVLDTDEDDLIRDVHSLAAVLLVGPDIDNFSLPLVRIFHPSFRDFLLERCIDERFSVNESIRHRKLALYYLDTLNNTLHRDICGIQNPTLSNGEVLNPLIPERIQALVSGATRYACRYWMIHLSKSEAPEPRLLAAMRIFASTHMFHWVELLSLIGQVDFAIQHLTEATTWCKVGFFVPI
jgi:hypothetical protein